MTLRIGTYNARFLPHLPSNARRARTLADRIRDGNYDLLVLTEVFSDRARRVLVEKLAHTYPWNVQYIGSNRLLRQDSGLMLLSRLPFQALPTSREHRHPRVRASATGTTPDWPHVWFVEYDDCCHTDCLAAKGTGYVRVTLEQRPVDVFFTHMQARYDYQGPRLQARTRDIRRSQLQQLAGMVGEALDANREPAAASIILGDLNVDGTRSTVGGGAQERTDGDEWRRMLEQLDGLFSGGLADAWDRHVPGADPGYTFSTSDPHARRDYVLLSANDPALPLNVQHAALAYNLATSEGRFDHRMSDHLGINVDLNFGQAGCHPRDAHALGPLREAASVTGRIAHAGGLQWYRLEATATVEVRLASGATPFDAAVEVYDARDISRPMKPVTALGTDASEHRGHYALVGESFIRVGTPGSGLSGEYSLRVRPVD